METALLVLVGLVLVQTTYLTGRTFKHRRGSQRGDILLDTSVLIDGRIVAIARSGLIGARLIVPRSVVRELQFMADKADHDKRERARFGLEVIEKLQQIPDVTVVVSDDGITSEHGVDEQLIILAQQTGSKLCTIDYNLNKAARVQSVEIININELAHALRVIHLPGEKIAVELVQPGQDKKQAVGYLDDGTMVVVDDSRDYIGSSVSVELTRVLQTAAGRMMFAKRLTAQKQTPSSPVADKKTHEASARTSIQKQPRRHMSAGTTSSAPKQPRPGSHRRSKSRRETPEDTLVDLANKS
jgi:uncharacterized protein YacL